MHPKREGGGGQKSLSRFRGGVIGDSRYLEGRGFIMKVFPCSHACHVDPNAVTAFFIRNFIEIPSNSLFISNHNNNNNNKNNNRTYFIDNNANY